MAYTVPTLVAFNLRPGTAVPITDTITEAVAQTPFQLVYPSGQYWGQVTFQAVLDTVSVFKADLEYDMTGDDANFVVYVAGKDFAATNGQSVVLNLNGGNIRYRFNVTDWTGTGAVIWAITG